MRRPRGKPGRSRISVGEFYTIFDEDRRLFTGLGRLEFEHGKSLLGRFLPPPPATVLDVGGGTGRYSSWLAGLGYDVLLVEPSAKLITEAERSATRRGANPLFLCLQADTRSLDIPDGRADAILLFGPVYHLTEKRVRLRALAEVRRVLKGRGLLVCAAISRFASAVEGLSREFIKDPVFAKIVDRDLA